MYECSAAAFQERQKILAEEWKPNNPVLKFLPIARKLMSQAELEEAISKDIVFNLLSEVKRKIVFQSQSRGVKDLTPRATKRFPEKMAIGR